MGNTNAHTNISSMYRNKQMKNNNEPRKGEEIDFLSVEQFNFHEPSVVDSPNGLIFNDRYLPEEIVIKILSFVSPKELLKCTLVCKIWCNIIKSEALWHEIYNRVEYPKKAKLLPWYVFYSYFATNNYENLLKNGNGQEKFKHWTIIRNGGDQFKIEDPPNGSDNLPLGISEFNGGTSCFVTSFQLCCKIQNIPLNGKRLLRYILNKFMPHIYVSEWVAARFDCGCVYELIIKGCTGNNFQEHTKHMMDCTECNLLPGNNKFTAVTPEFFYKKHKSIYIEQWAGKSWEKVEMIVDQYPLNLKYLVFEHSGRDTQFWAGHYGPKMAGGVVKILFDSIEPLEGDQEMKNREFVNVERRGDGLPDHFLCS